MDRVPAYLAGVKPGHVHVCPCVILYMAGVAMRWIFNKQLLYTTLIFNLLLFNV